METRPFELVSKYQPAGDQPQAIAKLVDGLANGLAHQTLLGVTGSGKTYTIANVIATVQRPTLVMAHNKTLAAQLYGELREFFPKNAVEYFVSYYDYYQPEAYVPSSDTYIAKDASTNEHIEQMRLSATKALLERSDAIIVATVSCIYGLGDPQAYLAMVLHLVRGERIDQRRLLRRLAEMQYTRNDVDLQPGTFRVRGDIIDIFPAESAREAVRVELYDDSIENLSLLDPLLGKVLGRVPRYTVYPGTHYVTPRDRLVTALDLIREEMRERLKVLYENNKLVEAQRLEQRTQFDLEMIREVGYCPGIENYSRYLSGRENGEPPPCLFDYHHRRRRRIDEMTDAAQLAPVDGDDAQADEVVAVVLTRRGRRQRRTLDLDIRTAQQCGGITIFNTLEPAPDPAPIDDAFGDVDAPAPALRIQQQPRAVLQQILGRIGV